MNGAQVRKFTFALCVGMALLVSLAQPALAQQPTSTKGAASQDDPPKSKRKLGKVSKPADFTGAGLLQFEYGYDGDFRAPDARRDEAGTASVLLNATEDLQFQLDFDTVHALTNNLNRTEIGIGDTYASAQLTLLAAGRQRPSLGVAYLVKLPTASESAGLGTGRGDHKLGVLASKKVKTTDIDVNASLLVNGRSDARGWEVGYQLALGYAHDLTRSLTLQGEVFGETLDTDQPRGMFVQSSLAYQPSTRASVDVGVRAGLSASAARFGILAGVSFSLVNLREGGPVK